MTYPRVELRLNIFALLRLPGLCDSRVVLLYKHPGSVLASGCDVNITWLGDRDRGYGYGVFFVPSGGFRGIRDGEGPLTPFVAGVLTRAGASGDVAQHPIDAGARPVNPLGGSGIVYPDRHDQSQSFFNLGGMG